MIMITAASASWAVPSPPRCLSAFLLHRFGLRLVVRTSSGRGR